MRIRILDPNRIQGLYKTSDTNRKITKNAKMCRKIFYTLYGIFHLSHASACRVILRPLELFVQENLSYESTENMTSLTNIIELPEIMDHYP